MWVLYAFGSALFAGLTAILAKCGIRKTDSTVATAIRTIVVLAFSWRMVFLAGSQEAHLGRNQRTDAAVSGAVGPRNRRELAVLFHGRLQIGDVNKVVPVDKSSTVLHDLARGDVSARGRLSLDASGIGVVLHRRGHAS